MYTATMEYHFRPEFLDQACDIWREEIFEFARKHEGFVRMQFMTSGTRALAVGTWRDKTYANSFMATGVFRHLLSRLEGMTTESPIQAVWDLKYYDER